MFKMLKIAAVIALMFFVSCAWSSCDSCGGECAPVCGTRRFRACCFNYLRRKRGPDALKMHLFGHDVKDSQTNPGLPVFIIERLPITEEWNSNVVSSKNYPSSIKDIVKNRLD